jgi:hypothetical protein
MKPYHRRGTAHRRLKRGDRGNDVANVQIATGSVIDRFKLGTDKPPTGGQLNQRTAKAITEVAYRLGAPLGHPITVGIQRMIRDPRRRTPAARLRARRRRRKANQPGYRIIRRAEWGARAPLTQSPTQTVVQRLFVHHTVYATMPRSATVAQECARMRQIQQGAFGSGFSDVPYNYVVFPSGRVYEGRQLGRVGAHTLNNNSTAKGLAFDGNYMTSTPTPASLTTARRLRARETPGKPVTPHDAVFATACPGDNLRSRLGEIAR